MAVVGGGIYPEIMAAASKASENSMPENAASSIGLWRKFSEE